MSYDLHMVGVLLLVLGLATAARWIEARRRRRIQERCDGRR